MTLSELKSIFTKELNKNYLKEEILSFYYLLIEDHLSLARTEVFLEPNREISKNDLTYFEKAILSLKQEKPIQYIIGVSEFYGLKFNVNENVLIPRPETEELVAWVLSDIELKKSKNQQQSLNKVDQPLTILDVGTGSGCIAISLAKNLPKSKISAIDISNSALKIAKQNAALNQVKVNFIEQDILKINSKLTSIKYDIIVSNPPYIRELEKQEIQNNVLQNEPHLALFVKNDKPLLFYDNIADYSQNNLEENGVLYLEINQYMANETIALLKQKGFNSLELREDMFGNKRMIKATKKSNL